MRTRIANFYNEIRRNVKRGVVALDRIMPNWADKINLKKLKMSIPSWCIVGQTKVCLNAVDHNLGFDLDGTKFASWSNLGQNKMNRSEQWEVLGNEWKKVITARQVQPKPINCLTPNYTVSQIMA